MIKRKTKILVVDDEERIIKYIKHNLEKEGYEVFIAFNGVEALKFCKKNIPDLVLADISMPGMDGLQLLMELRRNGKTSDIPFIFLTGLSDKMEVRKGMDLGADDYLTKPFEIDDLLSAVTARLEKQKINLHKLKKTEEQLLRSEKLALMGQLSAGIVHELKNIFTPIVANIDMVLMDAKSLDSQTLTRLKKVKSSSWQAVDMLQQILEFSRKEKEFKKVKIFNSLEKSLSLLDFHLRRNKIEIIKQYANQPVYVFANAGELEQVFTNLTLNACDEMKGGGTLTISVETHEEMQDNSSASCVEIRFSDSGSGIKPEILETIFEPFFTTKAEGKGTGLGLFMSHTIIEKHGGTIDAENEPEKGAVFIIKLGIAK